MSLWLDQEVLPLVAVNAAILNPEGKILLTQRSQKIREPGKWCLPGGHLDGGESWLEAIEREVEEEVGIKILDPTLMGIYSNPQLNITSEPVLLGKKVQFVVAVFRVTQFNGTVTTNDEVSAWDWFREKLPEPMVRSHPSRVQDAFQFNGTVFVR